MAKHIANLKLYNTALKEYVFNLRQGKEKDPPTTTTKKKLSAASPNVQKAFAIIFKLFD